MKNDSFKKQFINYFLDFLNTDLEGSRVVSQVDYFESLYKDEMHRHTLRWHLSDKRWNDHIKIMKEFALKRPKYLRKYLNDYFDLGGEYILSVSDVNNGRVIINNNIKVNNSFNGRYFQNNKISITAFPKQGFVFSHWEGNIEDITSFSLIVDNNTEDINIKPVFVKAENPLAGRLIIDEISTNNHKSGDWIELYNVSQDTIDVINWIIADSKHKYRIKEGLIPPDGFLVITQRDKDFTSYYDSIYHVGNFGFGLGKRKETIKLYSDNGALIDSVHYEVVSIDTSYTMELSSPFANNSVSDNWLLIPGSGSPGYMSAYYVESKIQEAQKYWVKKGILYGIILLLVFLFLMKQSSSKNQSRKNIINREEKRTKWRLTNFF